MPLRYRLFLVCISLTLFCRLSGCGHKQQGKISTRAVAHRRHPGEPGKKARAMYEFGWIAGQNGEFEKAIDYFKEAIKRHPGYAEAYHGLGLAYANLSPVGKHIEQAIPAFQEAIRCKPDYAEAYFNLGVAYLNLRQNDLGEEKLRKAIELNPNFAPPYHRLAQHLKAKGKIQEAIRCLLRYIQIEPKKLEGHKLLAQIYLEQGLPRSAAPEFREALKCSARDVSCLYSLGVIYHNENRLDQAAALYRKVLKIDKHHKEALLNLGTISFQKGDFNRALTCYERAFALDPSNLRIKREIERIRKLVRGNI